MTKINKTTWNKIGTITTDIINSGVNIKTLTHPNHKNSYFIRGDFEDLFIIKEQIKIHFPICKAHFVDQEFSNIFKVFWGDIDKNEKILEIIIPNADSKEIIKQCFNEKNE